MKGKPQILEIPGQRRDCYAVKYTGIYNYDSKLLYEMFSPVFGVHRV
jgi:hypothetical protein